MKRSNEKEEEETKRKRRRGETHEYRHLTRDKRCKEKSISSSLLLSSLCVITHLTNFPRLAKYEKTSWWPCVQIKRTSPNGTYVYSLIRECIDNLLRPTDNRASTTRRSNLTSRCFAQL